jgi:hypothetical protein
MLIAYGVLIGQVRSPACLIELLYFQSVVHTVRLATASCWRHFLSLVHTCGLRVLQVLQVLYWLLMRVVLHLVWRWNSPWLLWVCLCLPNHLSSSILVLIAASLDTCVHFMWDGECLLSQLEWVHLVGRSSRLHRPETLHGWPQVRLEVLILIVSQLGSWAGCLFKIEVLLLGCVVPWCWGACFISIAKRWGQNRGQWLQLLG